MAKQKPLEQSKSPASNHGGCAPRFGTMAAPDRLPDAPGLALGFERAQIGALISDMEGKAEALRSALKRADPSGADGYAIYEAETVLSHAERLRSRLENGEKEKMRPAVIDTLLMLDAAMRSLGLF